VTDPRGVAGYGRVEEELGRQRDLYESLLRAQSEVGEGFAIAQGWRIERANEAFCRISGYGAAELEGLPSFLELVVPEQRAQAGVYVRRRLRNEEVGDRREVAILHKSGRWVELEIAVKMLRSDERARFVVIARDITGRKEAEEERRRAEEKYRSIFENAIEGIFQTTSDGRLVTANPALARTLGYESAEEMVGTVSDVRYQIFAYPDRYAELVALLRERGTVSGFEVRARRKDRSEIWASVNVRALRDADGGPPGFEGTVEDITERRRAEEELAYLSHYDLLTGLANRALLQDRLKHALARAEYEGDALVALMFLDLDHFKAVNDSLGHAGGDELLRRVAGRIKGRVRESDTVARLGGDEFAIVLENLSDAQEAAPVAQDILRALSEPFDLSGHEIHVGASIGVAVRPPSERGSLLKDAETALHRAKERGRGTYKFCTEEMNVQALERLALQNMLRRGLERNEFLLRYQPQVDLATGTIVGVEALLRWHRPDLGVVSPARFVPVLEENGLIVPVGEWVLRTACRQARAWQENGAGSLRMAVNLSARQFGREDLVGTVARVLEETGLDPRCLELEITESLLMEDIEASSRALDELKRAVNGVRISIDDFGTGHSSLSYLKSFPIDLLKIDRSFVRDLATDPDDAAITTAIIGLAHNLRLEVIAEGVETEEQLSFLRNKRCDEAQGYYFGQPLPAGDLARLLGQSLI
jgi:diguanylate cyclase (GGDEF)-like protein/PAS domain S-box-containing protein